jgi:hypothetical protein
MYRTKTQRRSITDISGIDFSQNDVLERMLSNETTAAYKKPWHRLERGLRMNRINAFVDELALQRSMKDTEKAALNGLLFKSLDKKLLNSKTHVIYDTEQQKITEIKPLVMHQNANGEFLFQILEKRNAVTFRKRVSGQVGQGQAGQGQGQGPGPGQGQAGQGQAGQGQVPTND